MNRHITDGVTGLKVCGTSDIESYGIVARSVTKMFKIISIHSAHLANVIGRFLKKLKSKNNASCWRRHSDGGWNLYDF